MSKDIQARAHWGSRLGFILAAAGSAVGLGNIWRFPYQTGEHGGGLFVLAYLVCIFVIGLPVLMAEIFLGRTSQKSTVPAFRQLTSPGSPWMIVGWLGVAAGFIILSYYSVIAGWCMHYAWLSVTETFVDRSPDEIEQTFVSLATNPALSTMWHLIFMGMTISIVVAGIKGGIELWVKILMPILLVLLLILFVYSLTLETFVDGLRFIFAPDFSEFGPESMLAALGQGLFTLSVGMGAMITYGSYLQRRDDIVGSSIIIAVVDSMIAIIAAMMLFPILFAAGRDPAAGPGLVFQTLPVAFSTMPGGMLLAPAFFILLTFAALTSAISLLEVTTAYFIDERGWTRTKAALGTGGLIAILGIPSAIHGGSRIFGPEMQNVFGRNWLDLFDFIASNVILPLGALGIAIFAAWRVSNHVREEGFKTGTKLGALYWGWVYLLRFVVPLAVLLVFLYMIGVLQWILPDREAADEGPVAVVRVEERVAMLPPQIAPTENDLQQPSIQPTLWQRTCTSDPSHNCDISGLSGQVPGVGVFDFALKVAADTNRVTHSRIL